MVARQLPVLRGAVAVRDQAEVVEDLHTDRRLHSALDRLEELVGDAGARRLGGIDRRFEVEELDERRERGIVQAPEVDRNLGEAQEQPVFSERFVKGGVGVAVLVEQRSQLGGERRAREEVRPEKSGAQRRLRPSRALAPGSRE